MMWHTLAHSFAQVRQPSSIIPGASVRILGLPLSSIVVLLVVPLALVAYQYFVCWEIKTGRRE
jgi:hypothetical protein